MYYYIVKVIGDGSKTNPLRPDLSEDISFVGQEKDGEYLIMTSTPIDEMSDSIRILHEDTLEEITDSKGFIFNDVMKWYVGE